MNGTRHACNYLSIYLQESHVFSHVRLLGSLSFLGSGACRRLGGCGVSGSTQLSLDRLGDVFGKVLEVVLVETGHRDSSVSGPAPASMCDEQQVQWRLTLDSHVNRSLGSERIDGLRLETGETEHADLVGNVLPATGRVQVLEHYGQCGLNRRRMALIAPICTHCFGDRASCR